MDEVWLFSLGGVIFFVLTWATLMFLGARFTELYAEVGLPGERLDNRSVEAPGQEIPGGPPVAQGAPGP